MQKIKLTTIVGTRPEIIRMSSTIKLFDKYFEHRIIHTGQNSASFMKDVFFTDLGIRRPDLNIEIENSSLASSLGSIFSGVERELTENRPDAVVVLGDTNSALSVIIAKRMQIPVYHLEAGNRSFDPNVPEEINRKLVDHCSDFHLVYSEHARRNLLSEGIHARNICLIGSPMNEVINKNLQSIHQSPILTELNLQESKYFVVSAHRQENIDSEPRLSKLIGILNEVAEVYKLPLLVTAHPRMKDKLKNLNCSVDEKIRFIEPLGFLNYCKLQLGALRVISDSGSISEESAILKFKALTLRDSMERPEALETGSILMSGINSESLLTGIKFKLESEISPNSPEEYTISDTSFRVVNFILSTIHNYKFWSGIR